MSTPTPTPSTTTPAATSGDEMVTGGGEDVPALVAEREDFATLGYIAKPSTMVARENTRIWGVRRDHLLRSPEHVGHFLQRAAVRDDLGQFFRQHRFIALRCAHYFRVLHLPTLSHI